MIKELFAAMILCVFSAGASQASVLNIYAKQLFNTAHFIGLGSIDLTELPPDEDYAPGGTQAYGAVGFGDFTLPGRAVTATGLAFTRFAFSSGEFTSVIGSRFAITENFGSVVWLPRFYQSNAPIVFVWSVAGKTIDEIQPNFGQLASFGDNQVFMIRDDTIPLPLPVPIPLPAGLPVMISGIAMVGFVARRKRILKPGVS